jgi:hypothetical protein
MAALSNPIPPSTIIALIMDIFGYLLKKVSESQGVERMDICLVL